jgi:hypothetical protein
MNLNYSYHTDNQNFFPHPNQLTVVRGEGDEKRLYSVPIQAPYTIPTPYQDVGDDPNLQSDVTNFFYKKVLKWIKEYPDFKHLKKHSTFLNSTKGKVYIYDMLRLFVKYSKANWYDLRSKINYNIIKNYLRKKIGNI